MLDVAFHELASRAAKQMLAHERGLGVDERHDVLQLIAKAEGAAGLVVAASCPQAARQRLVQKPAVGQHVERGIRRFHPHGAERPRPVRPHRVQRAVGGLRSAEALHEAAGIGGILADAEPEDDLALLAVVEIERDLDGGARIERRAHLARKALSRHGGGIAQRAVAPQEFGAVAAHAADRIVDVEERDAVGELRVVGVARQERAALGLRFR